MLLNKEAILAARDLTTEDVAVPEWGGTVRVRVMSGAARDSLNAKLRDGSGGIDLVGYRTRLLVRCIVNEDGSPTFSEAELDALNTKSSLAIDRIFAVADRINAVQPAAVDAAEKN